MVKSIKPSDKKELNTETISKEIWILVRNLIDLQAPFLLEDKDIKSLIVITNLSSAGQVCA